MSSVKWLGPKLTNSGSGHFTELIAHLTRPGDQYLHGELALHHLAIGPVLLIVTEREGPVELPLREVRVGDRDGAVPVVLGQVIVVKGVELGRSLVW